MSDDRLADEVAGVMREQDDAVDAALEAYARGALSAEARAELEARAARDPELARALALYAPLPSGAIDAVVRRAAGASAEAPAGPSLPAAAHGPRPARWARRAVGAAAAVAALVLAVVALDRRALAPLPSYAVEARVGDAALRGEGAARRRVRADSLVEVTLAPERRVEGAVAAELFAHVDGAWRATPVTAEVSLEGAVRWRAAAEALTGVRSGTVALWPLVHRPGDALAPGAPADAPVIVVVYPPP